MVLKYGFSINCTPLIVSRYDFFVKKSVETLAFT